MRISDWSSDVCSSDLAGRDVEPGHLPSLFGHPERVAALAAAEVECRAWGEFLYDVRDGGVHPPRPDPILAALGVAGLTLRCRRSEERRVGNEYVSTCRSRWSPNT